MSWNTKQFKYRISKLTYLPIPSLLQLAYDVIMSHLETREPGLRPADQTARSKTSGALEVGHDQTQLL